MPKPGLSRKTAYILKYWKLSESVEKPQEKEPENKRSKVNHQIKIRKHLDKIVRTSPNITHSQSYSGWVFLASILPYQQDLQTIYRLP